MPQPQAEEVNKKVEFELATPFDKWLALEAKRRNLTPNALARSIVSKELAKMPHPPGQAV